MSFTVDYTTTVDGVTIKCSKPFNELGTITADDLREYAIAGIYDIAVGRAGLSCETLQGSANVKANTPVEYTGVAWDDVRVNFNNGVYNPPINSPHYGFSILVYGTEAQNVRSTTDNVRLVLDVPIQDIYCSMPSLTSTTITAQNDLDMSDEDSITVYDTDNSGVIKTVANNNNTLIHVMSVYIYDENNFFIVPSSYMGGYSFIHTTYIWGGNYSSAGGTLSGTYWIQPYYAEQYNSQTGIYANMANDTVLANKTISTLDWTKAIIAIFDTGEQEKEQTDSFIVLQYSGQWGSPSFTGYLTFYPKTERQCYLGFANSSLKFKYGNTMYKPIIENGVVIDYTNDMGAPSEFDDITTVTGNNVSPTPPVPEGDITDTEIDMPLAYIGGLAGMVNFIKIWSSSADSGLATSDDISAALSRFDITTIGKDLLRNFIAFKCFAVLNIDTDNCVQRQITVDGYGLEDENGNALEGLYIGGVKPVDFTAGHIDPLYNDFRDFAPYTKIEMYVPFCGWFTLPPWCMNRTITGTMFTDVYNGTVKAVIYADLTVVAEVGGCCAYDIPFVADATGAKAGAVISSALATAAATAATVTVPNVATGIAAASSAANMLSAINGNDTTLKGVMGDGSNTNGLLHVYLKITRPQTPTHKKAIPDTYKHEMGIPCYKSLTLTSGMGFTQVNDANVTGNMTATEKQMIIDGFRHGLIL